MLSNQAGEKYQKFLYTPFGELWKESGDPSATRLFTGQMYDKEIGHYYYNTRFYDPHLGVFTRPDPAMDGLNHYGYVHGNPINYTDPTGMLDEPSTMRPIKTEEVEQEVETRLEAGEAMEAILDAEDIVLKKALVQAGISEETADTLILIKNVAETVKGIKNLGKFIKLIKQADDVVDTAKNVKKVVKKASADETLVLPASMEGEVDVYKKSTSKGKVVQTKSKKLPKSKAREIWKKEYGEIPEGYDVDHIVQRQHGGTDELSNLQLKEKKLNRQEGSKAYHLNKDKPEGTVYKEVKLEE